jgi:hypothetical protein
LEKPVKVGDGRFDWKLSIDSAGLRATSLAFHLDEAQRDPPRLRGQRSGENLSPLQKARAFHLSRFVALAAGFDDLLA